MLGGVSHYLSGYVKVRIIGDFNRFLSLTAKSGIYLWGFEKNQTGAFACVKAHQYPLLRPVARRCHVKLRCIKKRGLPFGIRWLRCRKGLLFGALAFVLLYGFLGQFFWQVEVSGTQRLSERYVLQAAREAGVFEGAKRSTVNPLAAGRSIMNRVDEIGWVSVNTDGCKVTIEIQEREPKPDFVFEGAVSNLVAKREGIVVAIEAEQGMALVEIGEAVHEGQVLVTGIYTEDVNPYVEKKAPLKTWMLPARGSVRAQTHRSFYVFVPWEKQVDVVVREQVQSYARFFGLEIPLGFHLRAEAPHRVYEEKTPAVLLGEALPVGIRRERVQYYEKQSITLTEEALRAESLYQLRGLQREDLGDGGKVSEETLRFEVTEEGCSITATCVCEEEIALNQEVLFDMSREGE